MQQFAMRLNRTRSTSTEHAGVMRSYIVLLAALTCAAGVFPILAQQPTASPAASDSPPDPAAQLSKFERIVENQKRNDAALDLFERVERVEIKRSASDQQPPEVKVSRVIPAGTGVDHIPVGLDGTPTDLAAYRAALEKLVTALSFASSDGRAQRDAYDKIAKKRKERDDLIDATRTAFLFTFLGHEPRADRMLSKYRMLPNPAYKATSRSTSIYAKVRGYVWIDDQSEQLARVEGEVTDDISVGLFLAKVNKGSRFMQERYEFAPGLWFPSFSQYDFDGRKFFSSFAFHERTFYSKYRRIGPPKEALEAIRQELASTKDAAHGE
jgi:hypothetical protein